MANILVVEDEERVALSIERSLHKEHQVRVALDAFEANKIARRINPELIILDVMMPNMNGLELCRLLRSDPLLRTVPILFLTAKGRTEDKLEGLEAGADDYMTKPFDVRELLLRVQSILRRSSPLQDETPPDQITIGNLSLNCVSYHLNTAEKRVLLTPVEFDVICHMMRHPGQVFSSEQLLRDLWAYPSDTGSTDVVRMHIRNLRLKIEPDSRNPQYLITVPRHGYTLVYDPTKTID